MRSIDLYLQLPDEDFAEVVKEFQAHFCDISKTKPTLGDVNNNMAEALQLKHLAS